MVALRAGGEKVDKPRESFEDVEDGLARASFFALARGMGGFGLEQWHPSFIDKGGEIRRAFAQAGQARAFGVGLFFQSAGFGVRFIERLCPGHHAVGDLGQPLEDETGLSDQSGETPQFIWVVFPLPPFSVDTGYSLATAILRCPFVRWRRFTFVARM